MQVGPWQIVIVLVIVVLIFGAKKIPELTRSLGRSVGEFKKGLKEGNELAAEKGEELKKALADDASDKNA